MTSIRLAQQPRNALAPYPDDGPVLRALIFRQEHAVLDWEIVVDDLRHELNAGVERLRAAVREQNRAAADLERLRAFHTDGPIVAGWL
jgi:hypothetical protein